MNLRRNSTRNEDIVCCFLDPRNLATTIWEVAADFLTKEGIAVDRYVMTVPEFIEKPAQQRTVTTQQALEILRELRCNRFILRYDEGSDSQNIHFSAPGRDQRCQIFSVGSSIDTLVPSSWVPLVEALARTGRLAIAGTSDAHYSRWQGCTDPVWYSKNYGSTAGFRITRPFPPPLDHIEKLDITVNPGRFDSCGHGAAFVRADMWLGPAFWDYVPCKKAEVLAQPWLRVHETPHFLRINAYPEPFTRPDGEQGEIQRRLWRLLFHSDCQWPPSHPAASGSPVGE